MTIAEICKAIERIAKDELTVHPSVQPAADAATRKALWSDVQWLKEVGMDMLLPWTLRNAAISLANMRSIGLQMMGIKPWKEE